MAPVVLERTPPAFPSVEAKESRLVPPYRQKIAREPVNPLFHDFSIVGVHEVEMLLS